ncbi:MAG: IS110 family transposase [Bacilli bacterium]|nr:IS110 family transposase [Bacilli bacterium]
MEFYVGIDIAKYKHTVAIIDNDGVVRKENFNISNNLEGFNSLLNELGLLGQKEQIKIGMEATGHYMTCLAKFLNRNGYRVQIYNPFLIHRFKESETCNGAKTDKLDSLLIARYVSFHTFTSSPQLSYNIEQVRKIERAKYFLFADKIRAYNHLLRYLDEVFPEFCKFFEKNEDGTRKNIGRHIFESPTIRWILKTYPSPQKIANLRVETGEKLRKMSRGSISFNRFQQLRTLAKNSIGFATESDERIIVSLVKQIETIDNQIDELSKSLIPLMNEIDSPIVTIPGMGINLAAMIIGEIGDIARFDSPEKLIKFAGLDISVYQSGTMCSRGRITRRGSPILRYALSLCVQKLRIHSPVFSEYYYSKLAQGKCTNVAIIATTRKLIRVIWKMMISNKKFENINK